MDATATAVRYFEAWNARDPDAIAAITAWETADDAAVMRRNGPHVEGMRRFFAGELAAGGQTGVWAPHRLNGLWVRCTECGTMAMADDGRCASGHELPEPLAYW